MKLVVRDLDRSGPVAAASALILQLEGEGRLREPRRWYQALDLLQLAERLDAARSDKRIRRAYRAAARRLRATSPSPAHSPRAAP